jgi:hypothetical protein
VAERTKPEVFEVRTTLTLLSYDVGGFVGNYVCQVPCIGVYRLNVHDSYTGKWVCDGCKKADIKSKAKPSRKVTGTPMESLSILPTGHPAGVCPIVPFSGTIGVAPDRPTTYCWGTGRSRPRGPER